MSLWSGAVSRPSIPEFLTSSILRKCFGARHLQRFYGQTRGSSRIVRSGDSKTATTDALFLATPAPSTTHRTSAAIKVVGLTVTQQHGSPARPFSCCNRVVKDRSPDAHSPDRRTGAARSAVGEQTGTEGNKGRKEASFDLPPLFPSFPSVLSIRPAGQASLYHRVRKCLQ